jgi:ribosomal protein S12 methylthiotransferase accessory factor
MNFLNPYNLAGFADWQKEKVAHRQFDDSSNFFWIETKELISNTRAIVPSQLVYWNYNTSLEPYEPFLRQPISNGAAGHFTSTEAILSGIYENIQRDSFLIHWLNAIPPRRINQSSFISPKLKKLVADFERSGFEVIFLNTTLDIPVPSCVSVIIDKSGKGPRMGLGGGCAPDMEEALIRSLTEAMSVYDWLRPQKTFPEIDKNYVPFHDPRIGQAERLLLWGRDDMFQYMQQFLSGPMQNLADAQAVFPNSFSTSQEELEHMIDIFQKKGEGYELYVYEAKHKLLETLGYTVVRVVIPALVPLYLQENHAILGASRLKTAPIACGYTPAEKWNPLPHPFP